MVAKTGELGPYIMRKGGRLYATLKVPADVQEKIGRKRWTVTLQTDSVHEANRKAPRIVAAWQRLIDKARGVPVDSVEKDEAWFRQALVNSTGTAMTAELLEQIEDMAHDTAPTSEDDPQGTPEVQEAVAFYQAASGTGTDVHLEDWLSTLSDTQKAVDEKRSNVLSLAAEFPSVPQVTPIAIQKYVLRLHAEGLAPATLKKRLSAWRRYWKYLKSIGVTEGGPEVFTVDVPKASKKNGDERLPFDPEAIPALLEASQEDRDLHDLIRMAAYTGARIEELCSLMVTDVDLKKGTITITDAKSQAGNRIVPIHKELVGLMTVRVGNRERGRLVSSLKPNKYGDYSNAIGKRFGRLKKAMGYGPRHVFHSIRKTVATLLERANVPENVAADLVGHDKPTMTYGLYSGGADLKLLKEAVAKIEYPEV
jgi:integrase